MRKIVLLFALLITFSGYVISQPTLSWQFANYEVINAGTQLQFDVEVMADAAGTFHRDLQVYFDYNTAGFGSSVAGGVTVTPLSLMDSHYFVVNVADNTSSKVAIITEATHEMTQAASATYFNEMPTTFTGLFRITLNILSNTEMAGIAFDQALMNGGQYYQDNPAGALKYADPCIYGSDINMKLSSFYGQLTYHKAGSPALAGFTVKLMDGAVEVGSAVTDINGNYWVSGVDDGTYTIEIETTWPRDGLNIFDVVQTNLFLNSSWTFDPLQEKAADVWVNMVNIFDVVLMNNRLNSLPYAQWNAPDWVILDHSGVITSGLGSLDFQTLCSGDPNGSNTNLP